MQSAFNNKIAKRYNNIFFMINWDVKIAMLNKNDHKTNKSKKYRVTNAIDFPNYSKVETFHLCIPKFLKYSLLYMD